LGAGRPQGPEAYVLRVYSLDDGRVVAEKEMTRTEGTGNLLHPGWTADGKALVVFDRDSGSFKFLGPTLDEVDRIPPPRAMEPYGPIQAVAQRILVENGLGSPNTFWRLDLTTKRWKRLY
jgi:hypothetical protein